MLDHIGKPNLILKEDFGHMKTTVYHHESTDEIRIVQEVTNEWLEEVIFDREFLEKILERV